MQVYGNKDDYHVDKIMIAAEYAKVSMTLISNPLKMAQVQKNNPMACTLPALCTKQGQVLCQSNAILRFIGNMNETLFLYGNNLFEKAQIDMWLEFCWNEVEIPSLILQSSTVPVEQALEQASLDFVKVMNIINNHLQDKVYMVSDSITIADIALVSAIHSVFANATLMKSLKMDMENVQRYLDTLLQQTEFQKILKKNAKSAKKNTKSPKKKSSKKKGKQATPSPTETKAIVTKSIPAFPADWDAPTAPASAMTHPKIVEKFSRGRLRVKEFLRAGLVLEGTTVTIKGWARTIRMAGAGALAFLEINDGSSFTGVQVVLCKNDTVGFEVATVESGGAGASFQVVGEVVKSPAKGQDVEIKCTVITLLGKVHDNETYPMSKGRHSLEHLRQHAHLRPRSNMHGAAMRVRNSMIFALHKFFQERGFLNIHTPLITASDCEGAGEMFSVTTLLTSHVDGKLPMTAENTIDYTKDFFSKPSFLTVSGQLNVETHCCALSDCYTFGPTFRAENSNTSRHLAEFWMLEPEIAFADLTDDMNLAEDMLKYCAQYALENCTEDIAFFDKVVEKGLISRLQNTVTEDFVRITYTEAVEILTSPKHLKKAKFEIKPKWGDDLGSEHERYLTEVVYQKIVCIYNYPKEFKAFYMRLNDDNKTVAAVDILVPKIGEIIGGSQREDRLDVLKARIVEATGHDPEDYSWYTDLRKYGTVPHAGFGLGFERLIRFVTGIENIRDVIPFPRWPGNADF